MAKHKQKNLKADRNSFASPTFVFPAISVIIPMYNTEKYIGECLDSILAQTFQNFEVIVVDDCSTDSSYAIVESYAAKFGGRLTLSRMEHNTGGAALPRNKGLAFSRGEYIFYVDSDDFITKTALEELYTAAKNYNADFVYIGSRYMYTTENGSKLQRDKIGMTYEKAGKKEEILLVTNGSHDNLNLLLIQKALFTMVPKLVRRNFLLENSIFFHDLIVHEDFLWLIELLCCTKRWLRYPNPIYFWRDDSAQSITRGKQAVDKHISKWCNEIVRFAKIFPEVINKRPILKENPVYCYMALNINYGYCFHHLFNEFIQVTPDTFYKILCRKFENEGDFRLVIPLLFSIIDDQRKNLFITQQRFNQFAAQAQAQVKNFNQFAQQAQQRIAQLEAEVKRLQQPQTQT